MWHRNSPRLILARAFKALIPTVVMSLILWTLHSRFDHAAVHTGVVIFSVYYGLTRLSLLFSTWISVRWRVEDNTLVYRTGLLFGNVLRVPLVSLVGADVRQDRYERITGVHHLSIETKSAAHEALEFHALTSPQLSELLTLTGVTLPPPEAKAPTDTEPEKVSSPAAEHREPEAEGKAIDFKLTPGKMLAISITYGKYLLLVPVLYGLYNRLGEVITLPVPQELEKVYAGIGLGAQLGVLTVFLVVAVAYGYGLTCLIYGKFRIASAEDSLNVSRGFFTTQKYQIKTSDVDTLHIDQNLFMRISGLHRISVTSRSRTDSNRRRIVFPVLSRRDVDSHVRLYLPRFDLKSPLITARSNVGISLVLVTTKLSIGLIAALTLAALTDSVPFARYGGIAAIALLTAASVNRTHRTLRVSAVNSQIHLGWGLWTSRHWIFDSRNIVALKSTQPPIRFLPSKVTVSFKDGGQLPRSFALLLQRRQATALLNALEPALGPEHSPVPTSVQTRPTYDHCPIPQ